MPRNFSFIIPGKLAGMGAFARGELLQEDIWVLRRQGVGAVVGLTLSCPEAAALEKAGIEHLHLPVMDFAPPTQEQVDRFADFAAGHIASGRGVVVNCGAGMGRTGTMLACYLVRLGESAGEAIDSVRRIRPGSVETPEQEECVRTYERRLRGGERGGRKNPVH